MLSGSQSHHLHSMSILIYTESRLQPEHAVYDSTLLSGEGWAREIKAGQSFRIVDLEGKVPTVHSQF